MTQAIVDILEMIQVEKQNGNAMTGPVCIIHSLSEAITQQHPIGQTGKRIVMGQESDPVFCLELFGNITGYLNNTENPAFTVGKRTG